MGKWEKIELKDTKDMVTEIPDPIIQKEMDEFRGLINELNVEIEKRDKEIAELVETSRELHDKLEEANTAVDQHTKVGEKLAKLINKKDVEILNLKDEINYLKNHISGLNVKVKLYNENWIGVKEKWILEVQEKVDQYKKKLMEKARKTSNKEVIRVIKELIDG